MAQEKSTITKKWHEVFRQQLSESCAPACIRMMSKFVNGVDPGEGTTRCYVTGSESGSHGSLGSGGVVQEDKSAHDFTSAGTAPDAMVGALKSLRPSISSAHLHDATTTTAMKDKLKLVRPKNPMIIGVYWAGGGGHVMVGVDFDSTSGRIIVADPGYGVGFIEPDGSYNPQTGVHGNVTLIVYKT